MYLVWINPPINFTFSDDSIFLKKHLGGGHKFSEFACFILDPTGLLYRFMPKMPIFEPKSMNFGKHVPE